MFADNPMPICLSAGYMHALLRRAQGLATLPGLPLALTQDYITDVHTRAAGLQVEDGVSRTVK